MLKKLILIFVVFQQVISLAQTRDLAYYQQQAYQNNPVLRQNKNQQKILGLQQELIRIQNQKPQVYLSGDILLTPTFFSDNKFISFKNNYEAKSYGYDIFLTNRALYVGQLNVSKNLLGRPYVKANDKRTENLIQGIELDNLQIKHELDKNVIEQYIAVYQAQLQLEYLETVVGILKDRKRVATQLVEKGLMAESDFMLINLLIKEEENTHELFKNQLVTGIGQLNLTCNIIDTTIYTFLQPLLTIQPIADKFQYQQKFQLDSTSSVLEQKLNELKYRPQLNVYGTTGYYSSNLANMYRNIGVSGGLHFTMPIYDGHQRKNVEKQIQLEMNSQQIGRDYSARQLSSTLYYLMQQIQATQTSIRLIDEKLQMHKTVLGILKDKMMLGQTSVMDYILSVQEYATTFQNKALSEANLLSLINNYNYINW